MMKIEEIIKDAVIKCYENKQFIAEYNSLTNSNFREVKTPLEQMIDIETGKTSDEILKFIDFVFKFVVIPVLLDKENIGVRKNEKFSK